MLEVLLDNKDGKVWDISGIVTDVNWKTNRLGQPGSLNFALIKGAKHYQSKDFKYANGDIVRVKYKDHNMFYGYIFNIESSLDENVKILAYDQLRYLKNSDMYTFSNVTATEIIQKIASDYSLQTGRLDDSGYRIPSMVEDGTSLIDVIDKAIVYTLWHTNQHFVLFDDFGSLSLRNVEDMLVDFYIGDWSLLYDFKSTVSIDSDTYNQIKLYKDDQETGERKLYKAEDSVNIAKWGMLQLYQSVDEDKNEAQIGELLDQLSTLKNRETKTMKVEAIGDIRVRAGCYVPIVIEQYGINQPFLVNECQHRIDGAGHTMSLELKVI
ncbi:XkdQ/YqbQ family protein [Bacillus horti]|uniref:YqbQ/XkdQ domain-containing protein n=1 Tax=Caldalkalibacillus horti TaxID=77523 RepID=A0ABT9W057_9BACI|nr:hypothetical protein [Bacillus horti]MDQ0166641.1 hypothetical protein [Bacillus horti]